MPLMKMDHLNDPAKELLDKVGSLKGFELYGNQVLIGIYERPDKTKSGIVLPDSVRKEDQFQGKAGLVLALGPSAFMSDANYDFRGQSVKPGDWVAIFISDGRKIAIGKGLCRLVEDHHIRLKIPTPDAVF